MVVSKLSIGTKRHQLVRGTENTRIVELEKSNLYHCRKSLHAHILNTTQNLVPLSSKSIVKMEKEAQRVIKMTKTTD